MVNDVDLPTTTASEWSVVAAGPASAAAASTTPTTVTTATSTSTAVVTSHLCETRVDLLICLLQNLDELTRLLGIYNWLLAS